MKITFGFVVVALTLLTSCGIDNTLNSPILTADKDTAKQQLLDNMPASQFENDGLLGLFKKKCGVLIERSQNNRLKISFTINERVREERYFSDIYAGDINELSQNANELEMLRNELGDFGPDYNGEYLGYFLRSRATVSSSDLLSYIPGLDLFVPKKADIDVDYFLFFDENFIPKKFVNTETEVGSRYGEVVDSCKNLKEKN